MIDKASSPSLLSRHTPGTDSMQRISCVLPVELITLIMWVAPTFRVGAVIELLGAGQADACDRRARPGHLGPGLAGCADGRHLALSPAAEGDQT